MLRSLQKLGSVTIADGAAISGAIVIPSGFALGGIEIPTSWTAADLGFAYNTTGSTFVNLYSGIGTTVARFRITGIPTTAASFALVPIQLHEIALDAPIKVCSIATIDNTDAAQTGDIVLGIWVGRVS